MGAELLISMNITVKITQVNNRKGITMALKGLKVLCILYDDPIDGYPPKYVRDSIPEITQYPDGQSTPAPESIDFVPGALLGSVFW